MCNFKDLESKGFVVIPNFFSAALVDTLVCHYKEEKERFIKKGGANNNYPVINSKHFLLPYLLPLLQTITEQTNLCLNIAHPTSTYFDNQVTRFTWHQDHEPYYIFQDMYNAVNCWGPIIKPFSNKGGLGVIPTDVLEARLPDLFKTRWFKRGAKTFRAADNETLILDDDFGDTLTLPFNIEDIAVYPELNVGDLLVLRQDTIHKTQDTLVDRVAVSVRCFNQDTVLTKKNFLSGPNKKKEMINKNPIPYKKLYNKFIDENQDQIVIADLIGNNK